MGQLAAVEGVGLSAMAGATPGTQPALALRGVPVFCNALLDDAESARRAPVGDIELRFSPDTGLLWNAAYDPALTAYSPAYENSLHFSPRFQDYAHRLARRLVAEHGLAGQQVVEIGSGSGEFLALLVEAGAGAGVGYDPSHEPGRSRAAGVTVHTEPYPLERPVEAAAVVCRHVLEHLAEPAELLDAVRASLGSRADAVLYLEVPDAGYLLEQLAVWDVIYEHRSYFAPVSLVCLVERAGFEVLRVGSDFGGQFLQLEARPRVGGGGRGGGAPEPAALRRLGALVERFEEHVLRLLATERARLEELVADGPTAVWGIGSKGVTYLSLMLAGAEVAYAVDVNPHKRGRYTPVTAHRVLAPDDLIGAPLAHVVVMNPHYRDEVAAMLRERGLHPELHTF
ncbi:MAG: class I SAM-dependent methyltransferase [Acidimicrobiales bacterium]